MATALKKIVFGKGVKLSDVLSTELRFLSDEIRKVNNVDNHYAKVLIDKYDVPVELEITGELPKDLNKYDVVELVNAEILLKPKASGSGQFTSSELVFTGSAESIVKVNTAGSKPKNV